MYDYEDPVDASRKLVAGLSGLFFTSIEALENMPLYELYEYNKIAEKMSEK